MTLDVIILAAGQGSRMKSDCPKVLHRIGHQSLLKHVLDLAKSLGADNTTVVYGHGGDQVLNALGHLDVHWVEQKERLGTGHAVMQAEQFFNERSQVLILYGDVPLLKKASVEALLARGRDSGFGLLTVSLEDPKGYGRIVRDEQGVVQKIVEEKDASAQEKSIREVNTGILVVEGEKLGRWLHQIQNQNAQGEYYLTDIVEMAVKEGVEILTTQPGKEAEVLGVNDRSQLAYLERIYQNDLAQSLLYQGVTLRDPSRLDIRGELPVVGVDVELDVNVILEGRVQLGNRVRVGANTVIRDSIIGDDCEILPNTVIEEASIASGARIGPFARIRPGTELGANTHVGNFVEIKKSRIAEGSKVNHLSYIGDAHVGSKVNIGAGTITCNYDGVNKHQTVIGDGAFIGSSSQLVAPVVVGNNATIGAGSTITKEAPAEFLTLSRCKQVTIESWVRPKKAKET
jgi:bifunctional UDP-N-acetylglucosamine pyrophosphorylase/glucosamine-1-phosphate N-acetyltransferase